MIKVTFSLLDDDVAFVDAYARTHGSKSRSSVIRHAIELLRMAQIEEHRERASDWNGSEDGALRDASSR